MPTKKKEECCHPPCRGCGAIVLGILVLLNAYYAVASWPVFIGVVLVVAGIIKCAMCRCCMKK